jgi:hypothetical protein
MSCISFLRRIGLLPVVSRAEIEAADTENIERSMMEHEKAVRRMVDANLRSSMINGGLLESIHRARTGTFADMERIISQTRR